jgi:hypothetical protein
MLRDSRSFENPGSDQAKKLLELCGPSASSPFEMLIERLEQPDSDGWVISVLQDATASIGFDVVGAITAGKGGIQSAKRLKSLAKDGMRRAGSRHAQDAAVLIYTLAIASGLRFSDTNISSRPRATLADNLLTLAGVLNPAFERVAEGAALKLVGDGHIH